MIREKYIVCKTLLEAIIIVLISKKRLSKNSRIYYKTRVNKIAEEIEYIEHTIDKNINEATDILIELSR